MNLIINFSNWLNGWRYDLDDFLVRARRETDPILADWPEVGFVEECAIAVREPRQAYLVDRKRFAELVGVGA